MRSIKHVASKLAVLLHLFIFVFALYFAYDYYSSQLKKSNKDAQNQLTLQADIQKTSLEKYFATIESEITFLAHTGTLKLGLDTLKTTWSELGNQAATILKKAYQTDNPHHDKSSLLTSSLHNNYDILHEALHTLLHEFQTARGYHDILLLDTQGRVLYSVKKESNFAQEQSTLDANIQAIYHTLMQSEEDAYAAYRPHLADGTNSYLGTAVVDELGEKIGFLLFSLPSSYLGKESDIVVSVPSCQEGTEDNASHLLAHSCLYYHDNIWKITTKTAKDSIKAPVKKEAIRLLKVFIVLSILALILSYLILEKILDRKEDEDE